MGFLSQGVPNLVPWLIFRAWRGGRWDFRLWPFLGRFFGFCTEKLRFFGFDVRCSFWFFGFLAPAFLAKIKHVTDFSLCCESVQSDVKLFLCFYFTVNPGQIAMWDSGFLFEVYSSLCQALGQCRWAKKANQKRKKHESSENKVNLSLPSFNFTRFRTFIRSAWFSPLSWSLEQARFTAIESFLRTQNCPHCPLLLSNRGSLWILVDNPRADMPVLWP